MGAVLAGGQTGHQQGPKRFNKKGKRGRDEKSEEANQNEYSKTPREEQHTYVYFDYQNDVG